MGWLQRRFYRQVVLGVLNERVRDESNSPADVSGILTELNVHLAVDVQNMIAAARLSNLKRIGTLGLAWDLAVQVYKTPKTETDIRIALRELYDRGFASPVRRTSWEDPENLINLARTRWAITTQGYRSLHPSEGQKTQSP